MVVVRVYNKKTASGGTVKYKYDKRTKWSLPLKVRALGPIPVTTGCPTPRNSRVCQLSDAEFLPPLLVKGLLKIK